MAHAELYGVAQGLMPSLFKATRSAALDVATRCSGSNANVVPGQVSLADDEMSAITKRLFPRKVFDPSLPLGYRLEPMDDAAVALMRETRLGAHCDNVKSTLMAHQWVMEISGRRSARSAFRSVEVMVGVNPNNAHGFVALTTDVKAEMTWLLSEMRLMKHDFLASIALFLWHFLHVHPFADGNGRMSRMMLFRHVAWRWGVDSPQYKAVFSLLDHLQSNRGLLTYALHRSRLGECSDLRDLMLSGLSKS